MADPRPLDIIEIMTAWKHLSVSLVELEEVAGREGGVVPEEQQNIRRRTFDI